MFATKSPATICSNGEQDGSDRNPTVELVFQARQGSRAALEELLLRGLPSVHKWARRRLPMSARSHMDTCDLAQEVAVLTIARLAQFSPEHVASMPAYLRRVATNRVRDEYRRNARRPQHVELREDASSKEPTPFAVASRAEERRRYHEALWKLGAKDRRLIVARVKAEWSLSTIARRFRFASVGAARMAVVRAERRLQRLMISDRLDRNVA